MHNRCYFLNSPNSLKRNEIRKFNFNVPRRFAEIIQLGTTTKHITHPIEIINTMKLFEDIETLNAETKIKIKVNGELIKK